MRNNPLMQASSPGMILAFISSVFGILNFASACLPLGQDSQFAIGLIRLLLGFVSFGGALVYLMQGNAAGNLSLIFAVCFGLFSGSNLIFIVYNRTLEIHMQPAIYAMLQLLACLFVISLLPVMKSLPLYQWGANFCSAAGLFCFGFSDLVTAVSLTQVGGWFFLIFTFFSIYQGLSFIIPELPQGPSLEELQKKAQDR